MKLLAVLMLLAALVHGHPPVIEDAALLVSFRKGVGACAEQGAFPSADELSRISAEAPDVAVGLEIPPVPPASTDYATLCQSIYVIGSVYKCGKCDDWHVGGTATAWALSEDGLMVTNAHVFANAKGAAMGVCDREGRCHPVETVLASNSATDVAVFRVKGEGFRPLALGGPAPVGAKISVISHPSGNHYTFTCGEVSRYSRSPARENRPAVTWMSITADYAQGSSGGPVFNEVGEVVGMVASTRSIHAKPPSAEDHEGSLQMVVKNCVPASAIRELIGAPKDDLP